MSKVNTLSFRLGTQRGWNSIWHVNNDLYGLLVQQDLLIRHYIKGCLLNSKYNLIVNDAIIKHTVKFTYIHIFLLERPSFLAKSSLISFTTYLNENISRILQKPTTSVRIFVHTQTKEQSRLDPKVMVEGIRFLFLNQQQKRLTGRRRKTFLHPFFSKSVAPKNWRFRSLNGWFYFLLKERFKKVLNKNTADKTILRGLCFKWTGRLSRGARSRSLTIKRGFIPYQTVVRPVEYGDTFIITKFGLVHLEIWLYRTRK